MSNEQHSQQMIPGIAAKPADEPKTYNFMTDPRHAWLMVPMADVRAVGFKPSQFSFHRDGIAYLEQDCDAPDFLALLAVKPRFTETHTEEEAPCRSYRRFAGKNQRRAPTAHRPGR
jgi:hypothetical protein